MPDPLSRWTLMTHSWGVLGGTSSTMTMNSIFPMGNSFPSAVLISAANRTTTKLVRAECIWSAYVMPYPNPLHRVVVYCVRWSCYSCHNRHRIQTCKQNVLIIANEVHRFAIRLWEEIKLTCNNKKTISKAHKWIKYEGLYQQTWLRVCLYFFCD